MIENDKWPKWLTKFKVYVKKKLWTYIDREELEIDTESCLLIAEQDVESCQTSKDYLSHFRRRQKKSRSKKGKLYQYFMQVCSENTRFQPKSTAR
jgi:hypothetical protein